MDIATLLGIVLGILLIGWGIFMLTPNFIIFWSPASLAIVFGGSLAASFISFPLREVLRVFKVIAVVFKKEKAQMRGHVDNIVELASSARKGITELEKVIDQVDHPFLKDGIQMVIDGYGESEIREILGTRIVNRELREKAEANVLKTMGKYSPAFGMIGTLIGLVVMLYGMSEIAAGGEDPMEKLGVGMGTALITTFYGIILANLIFNPMGVKIEARIEKETTIQAMLIEGVILLHDRKHPLIVREKLNSFLPPREWTKPEEETGR
jgi:chemotaxis protein MotA